MAKKTCPNCNHDVNQQNKFCTNCGYAFNGEQTNREDNLTTTEFQASSSNFNQEQAIGIVKKFGNYFLETLKNPSQSFELENMIYGIINLIIYGILGLILVNQLPNHFTDYVFGATDLIITSVLSLLGIYFIQRYLLKGPSDIKQFLGYFGGLFSLQNILLVVIIILFSSNLFTDSEAVGMLASLLFLVNGFVIVIEYLLFAADSGKDKPVIDKYLAFFISYALVLVVNSAISRAFFEALI